MRTPLAILLAGSLALAAGCGDESSTDAFLTIVGSPRLSVDEGESAPLSVRYHDAADNPLAGKVSFRIDADPVGVSISRGQAAVDADGEVTVRLSVARGAAARIRVIAEAEGARPVAWTITRGDDDVYSIESRFVFEDGLPERELGAIIRIIDMTDDAGDPARWVLDEIEDELHEPFETMFELARRGFDLDEELNEELFEEAPEMIADLKALGRDLADLTENLGVASELDLARGTHEITGVTFYVGGDEFAYGRKQIGLDAMRATDLDVSRRGDRVEIAEHEIVMAYGELLNFGVDEVVVPRHDEDADSLRDLAAGMIDCGKIGRKLDAKLKFGSTSMYRAACKAAVGEALEDLDEPFADVRAELELAGDAVLDGDEIEGTWEGELDFGDLEVEYRGREAADFSGTR
jgi:hypothetical protein